MDGYVIIGTELDTKGLEKDLKDAERSLKQFQKEEEKLLKQKGKIELNLAGYEEEKKKIKSNTDEMLKKAETEGQVSNLLRLESIELDGLKSKYSKQFTELDGINSKLQQNTLNQGLMNTKIQEANDKLGKSKGLDNIKKNLKSVNSGLRNTVKSVVKWSLAVFSVRSALSMVRQASSTLAQYDKGFAKNLEYIRFALAQAVAPVLKYLVNLAFTLLKYLNYILNAWFGINLFANAGAKNMNKMAGSAEKVKKSLQTAGFDEMNIQSDTSSGGAGASGGVMPSMDLSSMDMEVPEWLQWIVDHKDEVLAFMVGLAGGLLAIQLGLEPIKGLGVGVLLTGVLLAIKGIMEYLEDPSWQNFGKIIGGIGLAVLGLGLIIGNTPVIVAGAIATIMGLIIANWETISTFIQDGLNWLKGKSDWVHEFFGDTIGDVYDLFVDNLQAIFDIFDGTFKSIKGVLDGIIMFIKGVFTGDWRMAWEGLKLIFKNIFDGMVNIVKNVMRIIQNVIVSVGRIAGGIVGGALKAVVNGVLWLIEKTLNFPIRSINRLLDVINKVPGINLGYLPTFRLPRLATGAVINNPGRGVPVAGGRAIAGEAGQEGIIPLTDSQAMETLGEAIGRYITINANITNKMDSRTISRLLQQIKQEEDFAYNY